MLRRIAAAAVVLLLAHPTRAAAEPAAAAKREVCGTGSVLNLRGSPSMRAPILDRLPDELDVVVLGTSATGEWLKVRDDGGRTGWVARRFTCAEDGRETVAGPWRDPAPGACVTSKFGPRSRPCRACSKNHRGIDLAVCGSAVLAAASGRVMTTAYDRKGGNYVAIDHGGGLVSYYLHLRMSSVQPGQRIAAGTKVGIAGRTGAASTGCHLHFEIRRNGKSIDPQSLLRPAFARSG